MNDMKNIPCVYETFYKIQSCISIDRKVLLLLDKHESHISIPSIELAKANEAVVLSFPPHCSHKL